MSNKKIAIFALNKMTFIMFYDGKLSPGDFEISGVPVENNSFYGETAEKPLKKSPEIWEHTGLIRNSYGARKSGSPLPVGSLAFAFWPKVAGIARN